jgi:DHA1 family multidrug resistance protein-like MFS transporter
MQSWERTLWVSWFTQILAQIGFSFIYPFLPLYIQHLGVHDQRAILIWSGFLFGSTTVAMAVSAPIWGNVADRFGRKPMVLRAMGCGAVLAFLMLLAQNPVELMVLRILQGVLTGSVAASQALVAGAVPRERLGYAMGLMQMAVFTGSSIGPLVGGQLVDRIGFQPTFLVAALLLAVATLLTWLYVDEEFERTPASGSRPKISFWAGARRVVASRQAAILIVVLCAVQFGGQIVGPILPVFVQTLGANSSDAAALSGNVFAIAGICSAVSAVLTGRITDRRGRFKLWLLLSTVATALVYVPQYGVGSINQLYLLRALTGLSMGMMLATASAMLSLSTPRDQQGAVMGLSAVRLAVARLVSDPPSDRS